MELSVGARVQFKAVSEDGWRAGTIVDVHTNENILQHQQQHLPGHSSAQSARQISYSVFDGVKKHVGLGENCIRIATGPTAPPQRRSPALPRTPSEYVEFPTVLVLAALTLAAAFMSVVGTGLRLSIAEIVFGADAVRAVQQGGQDGAAPSRAVGVALLLLCFRLGQQASREIHQRSSGVGAPSGASSSSSSSSSTPSLVTSGPYAMTRNPFFVAVMGGTASLALVFDTLWVVVWMLPLVWFVVRTAVPEEESSLRLRFPTRFHYYCATTPRWVPMPLFWKHTSAVRLLSKTQKQRFIAASEQQQQKKKKKKMAKEE